MAYVYRHIRLDKNEVFYVGIALAKTNYYRAYEKCRRSKFWERIINKTPYEVEIMLDDLTWEEACKKEIEFIQLYGRKNLGKGTLVNLTDGGEGTKNKVVSEITKNKIRQSKKDKPYKHNAERLAKISLCSKGRVWDNERKRKQSEKFKGENNPSFGRKHSKEVRDKARQRMLGNRGHRCCIVLNTITGIYYDAIMDAAQTENISASNLRRMLRGERKNWTNFIRV